MWDSTSQTLSLSVVSTDVQSLAWSLLIMFDYQYIELVCLATKSQKKLQIMQKLCPSVQKLCSSGRFLRKIVSTWKRFFLFVCFVIVVVVFSTEVHQWRHHQWLGDSSPMQTTIYSANVVFDPFILCAANSQLQVAHMFSSAYHKNLTFFPVILLCCLLCQSTANARVWIIRLETSLMPSAFMPFFPFWCCSISVQNSKKPGDMISFLIISAGTELIFFFYHLFR